MLARDQGRLTRAAFFQRAVTRDLNLNYRWGNFGYQAFQRRIELLQNLWGFLRTRNRCLAEFSRGIGLLWNRVL